MCIRDRHVEGIVLKEISQTQKFKYCILSLSKNKSLWTHRTDWRSLQVGDGNICETDGAGQMV